MSANPGDGARTAWRALARQRLEPAVRAARNGTPTEIDLARARNAIMVELDAAFTAAADIRVALNSLSPACRLPPEIILQILKLAQSVDPPHYWDSPYLGWLSLTQVSQLWRGTALECSSLWSQVVVCLGRHWADTFVVRSRSCPLHIQCDPRTTAYRHESQYPRPIGGNEGWRLVERAVTYVLETALQRIATIDLEAPSASLNSVLPGFPRYAPNLSTLTALTVRTVHGRHVTQLPYDSFAGIFPSLTRLSLPDTLAINFWGLCPKSLKSITVTSGGAAMETHNEHVHVFALKETLRRTTELLTLSIHFEFLPSWMTLSRDRYLFLGGLKTLSLSGNAKACAEFTYFLPSLRGLCKLDINVTGSGWEALCVDSILSATKLVSGPIHPQPFTSLSITGSFFSNPRLCLLARRAVPCPLGPDCLPRTHPDLSLQFAPRSLDKTQFRDLLAKLMSSINTTRVKSLHVFFPGLSAIDWTAVHWLDPIRDAQAVQDLHVRGECSSLIQALGASTGIQLPANQQRNSGLEPVTDATRMVFPALRSLVFEDVDFNYANARVPAHQVFSRVLSTRAPLSGVPRKLELRKCQLDQDSADWWESSVPARMRDWSARSLRSNTS